MKRAVIVLADGYESQEQQQQRLTQCQETRVVRAMTVEDRYYQLQEALEGLGEGDQVHVSRLHYLGESLTQIVHALSDIHQRGLVLLAQDQPEASAHLGECATLLRQAERGAMAAQVAGLKKKAASRRSATPPKCILIPVEFAD